MVFKFNRFAIVPVMCNCCHRFIWLSPYRRADVWHHLAGRYWKENICHECIGVYNVGAKKES